MTPAVIVDTNVVLVANGQHPDVSDECVASCAMKLESIKREGRIALDDAFRILGEYQHKTRPNRAKGPGDAFVKWVLQNMANEARCDLTPIEEHEERGFESFPEDADLANFDMADRKFVAVAAAHPEHPAILQAADSKWLDWSPALDRCGLRVEFICEADIRKFHSNKFGT